MITRFNPNYTNAIRSVVEFKFKRFQREDYARAALAPEGAVLGHDTGGGKGLALFVIPALKTGFKFPATSLQPLAPVLLVAPGDLHQQVMDEGREKFKAVVTVLDSQERFLELSHANPLTGRRELPPGYYITSYTQLASNGVTPFPKWDYQNLGGIMLALGLTERDTEKFFDRRGQYFEQHYQRLRVSPDATLRELDTAFRTARNEYNIEAFKREVDAAYQAIRIFFCAAGRPVFANLSPANRQAIRDLMVQFRYKEYAAGIGESRWVGRAASPLAADPGAHGVTRPTKIKCVYSPSLADLCQDSFAAVAVDEGVKMKGEDTIVGQGIRQMNAAYRLVLTATPIKNRLPDVFRLAWWAAGARSEAHARFPYPDDSAAREDFANEFLVSERNLSKEEKSETNRRFVKLTPQVCNIHRLWKIMAPVILRRRKKDFGEDIVAKIRQPVRVPLGAAQAAVYKFHIDAEYLDINGRPAIGAQLQALRIASANPASQLLQRPVFDRRTPGEPRTNRLYVPKLHAALKLIHQCLARGEQAVVFSAFHDSLDVLAARLDEAGVKHCLLDGRTSQKKRAAAAREFKRGPAQSQFPVMLAGVECMAEGHSFHLCNNVILMCYSWAYDKFEQAINRVHRLNSVRDVNVYPIICEGSIDRKLEAMIQEKANAAELVLDGSLQDENSTEVNLAELLDTARKEFRNGNTVKSVIDERELEREWPPLRSQLAVTVRGFRSMASLGINESPKVEAIEIVPLKAENTIIQYDCIKPKLVDVVLAAVGFEDLPLWRQRVTC